MLPNLLKRVRADLNADVCDEGATVSPLDGNLFDFPILFMTGHGNVTFSEEERKALREYLYRGGLLFADDNYGMDESFRKEMTSLFPKGKLYELTRKHPVFSSHYHFPDGLPKIHKHDGKRSQAFGIDMNERTIVFYSYECDLGNGWEDPGVYKNPISVREQALRMGVNVVAWYLQGQRAQKG